MRTLQSKNIGLGVIITIAALMCLCGPSVFADKEEKEDIVALEELPAAVRATLQRESAGGTLEKIEKKKKDGEILYDGFPLKKWTA